MLLLFAIIDAATLFIRRYFDIADILIARRFSLRPPPMPIFASPMPDAADAD